MSVCGQNGQGEDDCAPEEMGASNRDLYKQKPASKVVRVLTVLAYLLSVSLAAILLSVYYVCVWKSPDLPLMNNTKLDARVQPHDNHTYNLTTSNTTGRGGSTVMPSVPQPISASTAYDSEQSTSPEVGVATDTNDLTANPTSLPVSTTQELFNITSSDIATFNTTDNVT